jgi:hypothetical protein
VSRTARGVGGSIQLGLERKRHDTTLALFKEREIDEAGGGMVCNVDGEEIRLMLAKRACGAVGNMVGLTIKQSDDELLPARGARMRRRESAIQDVSCTID